MNRKRLVIALLLTLLASSVALADPASWGSFTPASFTGIFVSPALATNVLDYNLIIGATPKITIGSDTYAVNWVQAFYVVSQDQETSFIATDGAVVTDWTWESKFSPGRIVGWQGTGTQRIYAGASKPLGFASFDITGNAVLVGLHVGYDTPSGPVTAWYKGTLPPPPPVPEPSSLAGLGAMALVGVSVLRRRQR